MLIKVFIFNHYRSYFILGKGILSLFSNLLRFYISSSYSSNLLFVSISCCLSIYLFKRVFKIIKLFYYINGPYPLI